MTTEGSPRRNLEQQAADNLEKLRQNPYPGRGIILGNNVDGDVVQVYWVMGRSENSRNRILIQEDDTVRTDLWDESKGGDKSLIVYNALKVANSNHIVSNGNQTDTIAEKVIRRPLDGFSYALEERTYEPDDPNFTPRISGTSYVVRTTDETGLSFVGLSRLSIIKRGDNGNPIRNIFFVQPHNGFGECIHTYKADGNPLPSFEGRPYLVPLLGNAEEIADSYWDILNNENKVSLVVKTIDKKSRSNDFAIRNKLDPQEAPK